MDTIETFLDNMFAPYPATPRLIEARSELSAMNWLSPNATKRPWLERSMSSSARWMISRP